MVRNQLLVVLARLLKAQQHHDALLRPVRRLKEVVELEAGLVRAVREGLVHARRAKVPHGAPAHDVDARRAHEAEVDGRVHLLGEALQLASALDAVAAAERDEQLLHEELAREGQDDGVKGHEGEVPEALAIVRRQRRVDAAGDEGVRLAVREEDEVVDRVGLGRVDGVGGAKGQEQREGDGPGVAGGEAGEAAEERAGFAALLAVGREARDGRAAGGGDVGRAG